MGQSTVSGLEDALDGVSRLCVDTAPIIYFVEANPRYDALVVDVFRRISAGRVAGITSVISLSEVLVQPLRVDDAGLREQYRELLLNSDHFRTIAIDADVAEHAAELRARYRLRTPDDLQIATGLSVGCEAFLTNDIDLQRVTELRVLVLDALGEP